VYDLAESTALAQVGSKGQSASAILEAALSASAPAPGLSWLDIGCGRGDILKTIRGRLAPAQLAGIDVVDWLDDELRDSVEMTVRPAEHVLQSFVPVDRVLMVEAIEHLTAPWETLSRAAERVAPGGRIVVTTPNVATLRCRLELCRGQLTPFRPDNHPHLTRVLPHVVARLLSEAGLSVRSGFAAADIVPMTGGRFWPQWIRRRSPRLMSMSVISVGIRSSGSMMPSDQTT
jgi:2-polyprenyl-3-methyl-5-hydroxy-6-metoxy-1,4-benzoquinol methylase